MKIRNNFYIREPIDVPVELFHRCKGIGSYMYLGKDDDSFKPVSHTELKLILRNMVRVGMLEVIESRSRFIERGTRFALARGWEKGVYIDRKKEEALKGRFLL